jgi:hypothetical protein
MKLRIQQLPILKAHPRQLLSALLVATATVVGVSYPIYAQTSYPGNNQESPSTYGGKTPGSPDIEFPPDVITPGSPDIEFPPVVITPTGHPSKSERDAQRKVDEVLGPLLKEWDRLFKE